MAVAALDDPRKAATLMLMNNCKTKVGATDADVQILMDHKLPDNHAGLCLLECLLTRGNMMKNGKFNRKGFMSAASPPMKSNPEKMRKLNAMVDECEKDIAKAADECETAKTIVQCTSRKGKDFGFKFPSRL